MHIFFLAATALLLAVILWYRCAFGTAEEVPSPPPEEHADQRLRQLIGENPCMVEALAETVQLLETVMEHPELGGPGFLLIQFPAAPHSGRAVVTAQYPNIREGLYRRIIRQELDDLAEAGIPEALLLQKPTFETESGGVVLLSAEAGCIPPEFTESLLSRRERGIALGVLAEGLEAELPQFSIRIFGADLLLSPERAATSIDG